MMFLVFLTNSVLMFFRLASVQEQRLPDARLSPTNEDTPPITPTSSAKVLHRWHYFYLDKCRIDFSIFLSLGWTKKNNDIIIVLWGGSSCHNLISSFHIRITTRKFCRTCGVLQKHSFVLFFYYYYSIIYCFS